MSENDFKTERINLTDLDISDAQDQETEDISIDPSMPDEAEAGNLSGFTGELKQLFRQFLHGVTSGVSEQYPMHGQPPSVLGTAQDLAQFAGAGEVPLDDSIQGLVARTAGMIGSGTGYTSLAKQGIKQIPGLIQKAPRIAALSESALAGGAQDALTAANVGEDPLEAGLLGAAMGPAIETPFRAGSYIRQSLASPEHTILSRGLEKMAFRKQGIPPEREQLLSILNEHGISAPGFIRPRDWFIDMLESRASRSLTGRAYLQDAADGVEEAMVGYERKVIGRIGPGEKTGDLIDSADMGKTLREVFADRVENVRRQGSALYKTLLDDPVTGRIDVDVNKLVNDLEGLLESRGFDPHATMELPEASEVHGLLRDLRKGAKEYKIFGPDGEIVSTTLDYESKELKWVHERLKKLSLGNKIIGGTKPLTANDKMKLDVASIIRENVHHTLEEFAPEYAGLIRKANARWRTYREMLRHPHAKTLLESDTKNIVNSMFISKDAIEAAREALPPGAFELARQRWIANLLFRGRKGTRVGEKTGEYVLDAGSLNTRLKNAGGYNEEIFRAAFSDAPEKLEILQEMQRIVQQTKDPLVRYRGESESIAETGTLVTMVKKLFTTVTFPAAALTGRSLTRGPRAFNPFLGGVMPQSKLDTPLIRGISSAAPRAAFGPQPQP
jgi:hypothetical protein